MKASVVGKPTRKRKRYELMRSGKIVCSPDSRLTIRPKK